MDRREELERFLPVLSELMERRALLVVLDNLESLLTGEGRWRDERWGLVVEALSGHRGLSRLVLTSRVRPAELDSGVLVEPIHALSLQESVLLARELPGLGGLMREEEGRALVVRTLAVVRGHPKLIELADAAAKDVEGLRRRLEEAEQGLSAGQLRSFFERGESEATAEEHLRVLEGWARGARAGLDEASLTLFGFLCGLEEEDRQHGIVRVNWGYLRRRLGREEAEPDLEAALGPLLERALVEVVAEGEDPDRRVYRLHPAIVQVGRAEAEAGLQAAVDRELAAFWHASFEHGLGQQGDEAGGVVVGSARRAVPYLVRLQEWVAARFMIQEVLRRNDSPATVAALLPTLRDIVEATRGTEAELAATRLLAYTLARDRPEEAEALLREVIERALAVGKHADAGTAVGDLVNLLRDGQRLQEALREVERLATLTVQAGLGPWTQLSNQGMRLQILLLMGWHEEVLREVGRLRDQMAGLPQQPGPNERVLPWNARESLLSTGSLAASALGQWQEALALLDEEVESRRRRGDGRLEVARTRFNAYGPLIRLERLVEAHKLLLECQQVFSRENDIRMLGMVLSARADLEYELGHPAEAVEQEERALRYSYLAGDVDGIAGSHFNLAIYLNRAGRRPDALPHRLASALIMFQTESGRLALALTALGQDLAEATAPTSFAEVCAAMERVDGVRFRELFAALPQRAASGDDALTQLLALARRAAPGQ